MKGDKSATQEGKVTGGVAEGGQAPGGRVQPLATPSGEPPNGPGKESAFNFDKAVKRPAKASKPEKEPDEVGGCTS
jgi:hypothetical protein